MIRRKNFIQAALEEDGAKLAEAFCNAVTFAAGFAVLTANTANDALDALLEAHPYRRGGGMLKPGDMALVRRLTGGGGSMGLLRRLEVNVRQLADREEQGFWPDFGNAVHAAIEPALQRFTFAVANSFGRCKDIGGHDINVFAKMIVAQSIASLGAEEAEAAKRCFTRRTVVMRGQRTPVPLLLESVSPRAAAKTMRELNISLIEGKVPDGFDIFSYRPVRDGSQAVANLLRDPRVWDSAVERADRLNRKKENTQSIQE